MEKKKSFVKTERAGSVKRYEDLDFTDDFLFCKILQNNPLLCKELTELILGNRIFRWTMVQ